jgi:ABC-type multidrug transport system permease subunit
MLIYENNVNAIYYLVNIIRRYHSQRFPSSLGGEGVFFLFLNFRLSELVKKYKLVETPAELM